MQRAAVVFFVCAIIAFLVPRASQAEEDLLVKSGCNKCHSIAAAGIEKINAGMKTPDLSSVGKFHDAAFFSSYLKKETAHAPHEGNESDKKHMIEVKATGADFEAIIKRLTELKGDKK